jgi:glycine betaine/proline transport system permease protein
LSTGTTAISDRTGTPSSEAEARRASDVSQLSTTPGDQGSSTRPNPLRRLLRPRLLVITAVGIAFLVACRVLMDSTVFPAGVRIPLDKWLEAVVAWITDNLSWAYDPIAAWFTGFYDAVMDSLLYLPALTVALILVMVVYAVGGVRLAIFAAICLLYVVAAGVWLETEQTLALLVISVALSTIIGVAVGIVASTNPRVDAAVRSALDAMQTFPSMAYLVPVVAIFGAGVPAAIFVTIVWATAPVARMTAVGLQGVPHEAIEAAESFGANSVQTLIKVKLPLARASIAAGINQTIMFSMAMATIAVLIGAPGLGAPVWSALGRLEFGQALQAGFALTLIAIAMDRTSAVALEGPRTANRTVPRSGESRVKQFVRGHHRGVVAIVVTVVGGIVFSAIPSLKYADFTAPPAWLRIDLRNPVNGLLDALNSRFQGVFDWTRTTIQESAINKIVAGLEWLPWPVVIAFAFLIGFAALRWRGAVLASGGAVLIGAFGLWQPTIDTLSICAVAVALALAIGFPLGVLMSRSDRAAAVIRPVLDVMQTLPIFLFVIPTVVILGSGPVAGALATTLWAFPPMVRMTNVALRGADPEVVEAATSFGATEWQTLRQVRVPLGMPTLLVGVNQTVLLALSMAVVSAFIGTPGLGEQILTSVSWTQVGKGLVAGIAMFILAVIIDRILTGFSVRLATSAHQGDEGE